jgi:hypothetical protein
MLMEFSGVQALLELNSTTLLDSSFRLYYQRMH